MVWRLVTQSRDPVYIGGERTNRSLRRCTWRQRSGPALIQSESVVSHFHLILTRRIAVLDLDVPCPEFGTFCLDIRLQNENFSVTHVLLGLTANEHSSV
jgi:hypothetical protein